MMINNASGLIHVENDLFMVADDNRDQLRLFRLNINQPNRLRFKELNVCLNLGDGGFGNSDFESLAKSGDDYYVIGGFSEQNYRKLLKFKLNGHSLSGQKVPISFKPEPEIQSGEIDIEALTAWRDNKLMAGFRDPTKDGYAQALIFDPNDSDIPKTLLSFDLDGRKFRDCARIDDNNFLILAGPKRSDNERPIYLWDGKVIADRPIEPLKCQIDYGEFRAEGICVRQTDSSILEILVGSDQSSINQMDKFKLRYAKVNGVSELHERNFNFQKVKVELYG